MDNLQPIQKTKTELLTELKQLTDEIENIKSEVYKLLDIIDSLEKDYIEKSEALKKS
jgi:uncharacterized protein YoxC